MASIQASQTFAARVLAFLGVPDTAQNRSFIIGWSAAEGTAAKNNPLATTQQEPGSVPLPGNSAGVQQYPTIDSGAQATADTLKNGNYPNILAALRTGGAVAHSFGNAGVYHDLNVWSGNSASGSGLSGYVRNVLINIQGGKGSISATDLGSFDLHGLPAVPGQGAAGDVLGAITSVPKFIGKITSTDFIVRAVEVVGGGVLILTGLYLLAKQIGLAPDASTIAKAAAAVPK